MLQVYKGVKMEKDKQKCLLIKMDSEVHKLFKSKTAEQGVSMTIVILKLVQDYLGDGVGVVGTEVVIEKE